MHIKNIQNGFSIYREWAESIKRRPLQNGVERVVTVVKDGVRKTMGKNSEYSYVETKTAEGIEKTFLKSLTDNTTVRGVKYPDGSYANTVYRSGKPYRTDGAFVVKKKDGTSQLVGYGIDGNIKPDSIKKVFMTNLDRMGDPKYDVDLRGIFEEEPKSKLDKFLGDIKYKTGKFFERFSKQNRELRDFAQSIDKTA